MGMACIGFNGHCVRVDSVSLRGVSQDEDASDEDTALGVSYLLGLAAVIEEKGPFSQLLHMASLLETSVTCHIGAKLG